MKRTGMTVIELLIIAAILLILAGIVFSGCSGCTPSYYSQTQSGDFQCVKTYTVMVNEGKSSKRVDLRPVGGGMVQTMNVDDSYMLGIFNSATLYAQFESGRWYRITSVGYRREGYFGFFPLVKEVKEIPDPRK